MQAFWAALSRQTIGPGRGGSTTTWADRRWASWEKGKSGREIERRERKKRKKEKKKKMKERERGSSLFGYENLNIYPLQVLNFQLRVRVILVVFSIFDNYETSSSFRVRNFKLKSSKHK